MKKRLVAMLVAAVFVGGIAAMGVLYAHDMIYQGTVVGVETERLQVKTVDSETKTELTLWFTVTADTRVKRGDTVVAYASADIAKDERIVVVVTHDAEGENVATELRLAPAAGY